MHALFAVLAAAETLVSFCIGLFFCWLGWRFWSSTRRMARARAERLACSDMLFVAYFVAWALSFLALGALSVAYPFNRQGFLQPPAGSLAALLAIAAYACLPAGVVLLVVAIRLAQRGA